MFSWTTEDPDLPTYFHAPNKMYWQCQVCLQYRSQPLQPPYRSPLADDASTVKMPWQDAVIDVQGPFTKAEGGEQYVLSYCCTRLKVPFLETLRALSTGFLVKPW